MTAAASTSSTNRPRFLVVEDDNSVGRALVGAIRASADGELAISLQAARTALEDRQYTGLILDVNLPDGSGLDLLAAIRATQPALPVLVVTGSIDPAVANRCHVLKAACVFKP